MAVLVFVLAGSVSAQRLRRVSIDPATGRLTLPARTARLPLFRSTGKGKVIGFTTEEYGQHLMTLLSLGQAAEDLARDGHTLVPVDEPSAEALARVDRLVVGLMSPNFQPTGAALEALDDFVRRGGELVYLGENNPGWLRTNRAFGGRFGITYPQQDPPQVVLDAVHPHPITDGPFGVTDRPSAPRPSER